NEIGSIFGLFLSTSEKKGNKTDDIMKIVTELRTVLKKNKNYELSDFIRNKLGEIGIEIKDTPTGTEYRIK
ncbi:MAG TPA: cysteine--tRNA ligase, partial [Tepiditoga sp.]|nr:cysteine--tRNA ligase [Tepiditoga sp.]